MTPTRIAAAGVAAALAGTAAVMLIDLLGRQPALQYGAGLEFTVYALIGLVAVPCCMVGIAFAQLALARVDPSRGWRAWYWALAFGGVAGALVGTALNASGLDVELHAWLVYGATSGLALLFFDGRQAPPRRAI